MARKAQDMVEELEVTDEVEDSEEETDSAMTPKQLAEELEVSPKTLRSFLRREFPRTAKEKNTSWKLTEAQVEAAREHFAEEDEDDDDSDEE